MTKFQLNRPGGPWEYPSLGFDASHGAILDGSLSTPPITDPPDPRWSVYVGASAETGITRYTNPAYQTGSPEPTDGYVLTYSDVENRYVPRDLGVALSGALDGVLGGKADVAHGHAIGGVTGLQAALDAKAAATHGHAVADVAGLQAAVDQLSGLPETYVQRTEYEVAGTTLRRQFVFTDTEATRPVTDGAVEWLGATSSPPTNAVEGDIWTRRTGAA